MNVFFDPKCIVLGLLSLPIGYMLVQVSLISHLRSKAPRDIAKYLMTRDIGNLHAKLLDAEGDRLRIRWRKKGPVLFGVYVYAVCVYANWYA